MPRCYLEGYLDDGESVYRIPINRFPALVGRDEDLAVTLQSGNVSRRHARILQQDGQLLVQDLGSTNGTFVNHQPVTGDAPLHPGDVVRFADVEFRLLQEGMPAAGPVPDYTVTAFFNPDDAVNRMPIGAQDFEQLLRDRLIKPLFQPIVATRDETIAGLELLGRGCHPALSELPVALFTLADGLGHGIELSEAIRDIGVEAWSDSVFSALPLFMNMQPAELKHCERLVESLHGLRERCREGALVLEIHERAVTSKGILSNLKDALHELRIDLAYDDFGAGQARLLELLDVPPYAVKFDISLIRDLDKASPNRQDMIGLLVRMVKQGESYALAEGVSNQAELAVCKRLGFDLIQGFVYAVPASLDQLEQSSRWPIPG